MHLIRRLKAMAIVKMMRRMFRRLPKEQQVDTLKKWFMSRAQWTRIVGVAVAIATALGLDPVVATLQKLAEAVSGGSLTEIVMAVMGLFYFVSRFFDRAREEEKHADLIASSKR